MAWIWFFLGVLVVAYLARNYVIKSVNKDTRKGIQGRFDDMKEYGIEDYKTSNDITQWRDEFAQMYGEFFKQNNFKEEYDIKIIKERVLEIIDSIKFRFENGREINKHFWLQDTTRKIFKTIYDLESYLMDCGKQAIRDIEQNLDKEIEIIMNDYRQNLPKQSFRDYMRTYFDSNRAEFIEHKLDELKGLIISTKHCINDIKDLLSGDLDEAKAMMNDTLIQMSNKCLESGEPAKKLFNNFFISTTNRKENIAKLIEARDIETGFDDIRQSVVANMERRYFISIFVYVKKCQDILFECLFMTPGEYRLKYI